MQSKQKIMPISIHQYRNLTQTTENTINAKYTNNESVTNTQQQKLKNIIQHIYSHPKNYYQDQSISKSKSYRYKNNGNKSEKKLIKNKSVKRYKTKDIQANKYEPLLSDSQIALHQENSMPKYNQFICQDQKQYTFGAKQYEEIKNKNPQNCQQTRKQFDLISRRSSKQIYQQRFKRERRKKFQSLLQSQKVKIKSKQNTLNFGKQAIQKREVNKSINPGKYMASKQAGLTQQQICNGNQQSLNYELQKYIRKKGHQYMKQISIKVHSQSQKNIKKLQDLPSSTKKLPEIKNDHSNSKRQQKSVYPNYIPEVFPRLPHNKKKIKTEVQQPKVQKKHKIITPNKQYKKYSHINEREQMLGKIVLDRVQDHFKIAHQKNSKYYNRVTSQREIDQAWIQYLKTKIDRADYLLTINK